MHVFSSNNELVSNAALLHCLQLLCINGQYGPRRKLIVLSHASVNHWVFFASRGWSFNNIHMFPKRQSHQAPAHCPDVYNGHFYFAIVESLNVIDSNGNEMPLIDELSSANITWNGILQDAAKPIAIFVGHEIQELISTSAIMDISCVREMGFSLVRPTSFGNPAFTIGDKITYYSVDHAQSYLCSPVSEEISKALLPHLGSISNGQCVWKADPIIKRPIDFLAEVIIYRNLTRFQLRWQGYPHDFE